jgi:hypothetical protein
MLCLLLGGRRRQGKKKKREREREKQLGVVFQGQTHLTACAMGHSN